MASSRYQMLRERTYDVLEKAAHPDDTVSKVADIVLLVLIVSNIAAVTLETVHAIYARFGTFFEAFDQFSVAVFSIEYVLRIWACTSDPRYSDGWRGRLRYARSPTAIIDLLAVLPSYFPAVWLDARAIRTFRLFRLLRLMKVERYTRSAQTLMHVMTTKKEELYTAIFAQLVLISVASSLMYYVEHDAQPEAFSSIPAAMWWGMVTLTTVGYGDMFPITPLGKVLGIVIAVLGIGMFALPAGILSSGFVEAIQSGKGDRRYCPHCGKDIDQESGETP